MIKTSDLKTVNPWAKCHGRSPGDYNDFMIQFRGNTILNVTRHRDNCGTYYRDDNTSRVYKSMREVKEYCVERIVSGQEGEILKDWAS